MTNYQYIETMNRLTNEYNKLDNSYSSNQKKHQILFSLLSTMYNNQFNKQINVGALAQVIVGQSMRSLVEQAFFKGNEKVKFDAKNNILKLGEVLQVSICECPKFMQDEGEFGKTLKLNFTNTSGECLEQFLLCSNENELWTEYNSLQYKGIDANTIYISPHQLKTYEKRTFDSFGIEVKREINTIFRLGISANPFFLSSNSEITEVESITNKIKITRDPNYFMIAKIEMLQRNRILGEYSVVQYKQQQYQTNKATTILKETYGLCPYGQSLDVSLCLDSYDEAINNCQAPSYLNVGGDINDKRFVKINPKLNFIPGMNIEIKRRIQNARTYYSNSGRKKY